MEKATKGGLLVACGFLLGTVGVKALTSQTAKRCYVQGVAQGLKAKTAYEAILEQAKAEMDDIVSEATYLACSDESQPAVGVDVKMDGTESEKKVAE